MKGWSGISSQGLVFAAVVTTSAIMMTVSHSAAAQDPSLDLGVTINGTPSSVSTGGNLTYTITVTGPASATGVSVWDVLPPGLTYVSGQVGTTMSCDSLNQLDPTKPTPVGATVVCSVGNLSSGSATVTIIVKAPQTPGTITNIAGVIGDQYDANMANNSAAVTTTVDDSGGASLYSLSLSPTSVVGGQQNSTATVTLTAPAPANGVNVALSSGNTAAATVPGFAFVPQGSTTGTATVTTLRVSSQTQVAINAQYGADSRMAVLTITAAPVVNSVYLPFGPTSGSQSVTIHGAGFTGATGVKFGDVFAYGPVVVDDGTMTALTRPHAEGKVDVSVVTPWGTGTLPNGYEYWSPPHITSISPTAGSIAGGTSVTVNGSGFRPAVSVKFGGVAAGTPGLYTQTQLTAVTGARSAAGLVDVVVTNPDGQSDTLPGAFTYAAPLVITAFTASATTVAVGSPLSVTLNASGSVAPLQWAPFRQKSGTSTWFPDPSPPYSSVVYLGNGTAWTWTPTAADVGAWTIAAWARGSAPSLWGSWGNGEVGTGAAGQAPNVIITVVAPVDDAVVVTTSGIPSTMTPGQTAVVSVTMRNTGTTTWTAATNYKLGDAAPTGGLFGPVRVPVGADVPPGGQATFDFTLTAPTTPGTYTFGWRMLQEMVRWFGAYAPTGGYSITVAAPVDDAVVVTTSGIPSTMTPGQTAAVSVTMRNTGTTTWVAATGYKLGDAAPTAGLFGPARVPVGADVPPGDQATFNFTLTAPTTPGTYTFGWRMLQEMVRWFGAYAPYGGFAITVTAPPPPPVSRLEWMAPGNTPGYTTWDPTPTDLILAGTVTNVPAGTPVTVLYVLWTAPNAWYSGTTTTNSNGAWWLVIPNANLSTNYSAYVAASGLVPESNQCWSSPDANRVTTCW